MKSELGHIYLVAGKKFTSKEEAIEYERTHILREIVIPIKYLHDKKNKNIIYDFKAMKKDFDNKIKLLEGEKDG